MATSAMLELKTFLDMNRQLRPLSLQRNVQALQADLRAETLSHAAKLTSQTTLLVFVKSGFVGTDEAGHGCSTVGLTRARGTSSWIRLIRMD